MLMEHINHTLSVYHAAVNDSRHGAAALSIEFQRYSLINRHKKYISLTL